MWGLVIQRQIVALVLLRKVWERVIVGKCKPNHRSVWTIGDFQKQNPRQSHRPTAACFWHTPPPLPQTTWRNYREHRRREWRKFGWFWDIVSKTNQNPPKIALQRLTNLTLSESLKINYPDLEVSWNWSILTFCFKTGRYALHKCLYRCEDHLCNGKTSEITIFRDGRM